MDKKTLDVTIEDKTGKILSFAEAVNSGIGDFSMRFVIFPQSVETAILHCTLSPYSKDELEDRVGEQGVPLTSNHIPMVPVKLGRVGNRLLNGLVIPLFCKKDPSCKIGVGSIPILESIGPDSVVFPDFEEIRKEVFAFFRDVRTTNNHK